jgi:hypothetical protein
MKFPNKAQAKPDKMFFWRHRKATSGIPGISERNRGKPRENPGNVNNGETSKAT